MISQVLTIAYGAALALSAVSGSGVSPIQLTTMTPHGLGTGDWVDSSGILGNTAANVTDQATVIDALNFTVPGTGNGAWTPGSGTVARYYGLANSLARVGHAALINNEIGLGPDMLPEANDYPRLVYVPDKVPYVGRAAFNAMGPLSGPVNPAISTTAPVLGRKVTGLMHCWGSSYDDAMLLADLTVIALTYALTTGNFEASDGDFPRTTDTNLRGREFVFRCGWIEGVNQLPVATAGSGMHYQAKLYLDGSGNNPALDPVTVGA